MKRWYLVIPLLLLLIFVGCSAVIPRQPLLLVSIEEAEGYTVENNGQYVVPGESAVFTLTFDRGISMDGTNYSGKIHTETSGKTVTLTLEDVRYPSRVKINLTYRYAEITYHANGGYGLHTTSDSVTVTPSLTVHLRPNTDTGTDLFARSGYTLLCWNTEPDGSGTRVGLGSRVSVPNGKIDLYAQWLPWEDASSFTWTGEETVTITGYTGSADTLVIPEYIDGREVTAIAAGAFQNCTANTIVLPKSMDNVEAEAFQNCAFTEFVLFDNIVSIKDDCFVGCDNLQTLYINAIEAPYGYIYRRESCYADKVDLLINAQGKKKLVCYAGCSMWYNLDGAMAQQAMGEDYTVINMALNGTVNSTVQMQIIGAFLEEGDIFFHTPEVSSQLQLLNYMDMLDTDQVLWCGIENNYDLFTYVDLQTVGGVFTSLCSYLDIKAGQANYAQEYQDDNGYTYMDETGSIPFFRNTTKEKLGDKVYLDPARITDEAMANLESYYQWYQSMGVRVCVSYACVNLDSVPEEQQGNAQAVEDAFSSAIEAMDGPVLISQMEEFLYHHDDFYDTNYHLLTQQTKDNTTIWLRDLLAWMEAEGLK